MEAKKGVFMIEIATEYGKRTSKPVSFARASLPGFEYRNGFTFTATDLGNNGVKIELLHENDVTAAIILPPGAVAECGRWMLKTLGQDKHGLPNGLPDILRRLSKHKAAAPAFNHGDKKKIKDAIRVLRS